MAARKTIKLNIDGLVPDENYMIQVRTVANGENSPWSRKYAVKTINDTAGGTRLPNPPELTSWHIDAAGQYIATFPSVTHNTDGSPTVVKRYELELVGDGITVIAPHYGRSGTTQERSFNFGHIRGMFNGQIPTTIAARLRVVNSADTISAWSEPAKVASLPVPNPPKNPVATGVVDAVKVTWEPPDDPIHLFGYRVYLSMTDENFATNISNLVYQGPATDFTYTSLSYDLMHYFKIVSYSEPGLESTSVSCSAKPISPYGPDDKPPTVPVLGTPTLNSDRSVSGQANLTWTHDGAHADNLDTSGFVVAWRLSTDSTWRNTYFEKTARAGSIDLPRAFANYEFKIAAYDFVANYSAFSDVKTLDGAGPAPLALTGVGTVTRWDGMKLLWNHSESQAVVNGGKYEVQWKSGTGAFDNETPTYTTGNRELDLTGLGTPAQGTYTWRVRPVDVMGRAGPWSALQTETLPAFPTSATSDKVKPSAAPQNVKAAGGLNYINASWDVVQNVDDTWYEIYMSATNNFTISTASFAGRTSATSIMLNTLPGGPNGGVLSQDVTYYVKVRAMDADGDGPVSAQASAQLTKIAGGDLGINMSGENLLYNTSFEEDSDGDGLANYWLVYNKTSGTEPSTATLVNSGRTGGKAQRVAWTGVNSDVKGIHCNTTQQVTKPHTEYTLSFYARSDGGTGFGVRFNTDPIAPGVVPISNVAPSATTWTRYIFKFTTGATVDVNNFFVTVMGHSANGGWIEFDDIQLEAGNIASAYKVGTVSIAKLASGTMETATMTIATGGQIKSADYDLATKKGFLITGTGINLLGGTVNAATLQSGTTITSDLFVGSKLQVATGGFIQSANYDTNGTGYRITKDVIDIRNGTVAAGTLSAGTVTAGGIKIGAGGEIIVDSTGAIRSNVYTPGTTGWKISSTGIEMWDTNSKINVNALQTGTLTSTTITIGSGGTIRSNTWASGTGARWQLSENAFTMVNGTITGSTIISDQIYSASSDTVDGVSRYRFSINAQGYAEFVGARIYGNAILGSTASNAVQSGNYNGSTGWKIMGDGTANFFNVNTWNARIYGAAVVGGVDGQYSYMKSYNWVAQSSGWLIESSGYAEFNAGSLRIGSAGGGLMWLVSDGTNGQIRLYLPGDTSRWHHMRSAGEVLHIRGGYGGAIEMYPAHHWWRGVSLVRIIQDCDVTERMFVGNNLTIHAGGLTVNGGSNMSGGHTMNGGLTVNNSLWVGSGELKVVSLGGTGGQRYVTVGDAGVFNRGASASSRDIKANIETLSVTKKQILALEPKRYNFKSDPEGTKKSVGFIAEEAEELGLTDWVEHDETTGKPVAFDYPFYVVALQQVAREQDQEIQELKAKVSMLLAALDK